MIHPELQKLLNFALQDGELSEKERELLHKKAIELGQDIDVLELVIEGELQKILKQNTSEKQTNFSCPNCGSSIPKSSIKCGFCDFEITRKKISGERFIEKLTQQLEELNKLQAEEEAADKYGMKGGSVAMHYATKKATIISTFSMPNDKEHLLEFFFFCDSNADATTNMDTFKGGLQAHLNKALHPAWASKASMGVEKLKRFANEDDDIKRVIESYQQKLIDREKKQKSITNHLKNPLVLIFSFFILLFIIMAISTCN